MVNHIKITLLALVFVLGIYFSAVSPAIQEGYKQKLLPPCPDLLLEENRKFYLYNSKLVKVPGVNPVVFNTLNDYVEFLEWQRSQGVRCNVQHLRKTTNAQGESVYRFVNRAPIPGRRPPRISKLVDAGRSEPPYNQHSYPSYDPQDQYVGTYTPLDKMFTADKYIRSANPMDPNWGGHNYTMENTPRINKDV